MQQSFHAITTSDHKIHSRQIYNAHNPTKFSGHGKPVQGYHQATAHLSKHDVKPDHSWRRNCRYHYNPQLSANRAASRGFPILADIYQPPPVSDADIVVMQHHHNYPHTLSARKLKYDHDNKPHLESATEPVLKW